MAKGELTDCVPVALARILLGVFAEATLYVLESGHREKTERVVDLILSNLAPKEPSQSANGGERRTTRHD